jgi:hypothetical protein
MERVDKARKLLGFIRNRELATFNELTNITSKLEELGQKETDMTTTNDLLQEVSHKLDNPTVIRLILD